MADIATGMLDVFTGDAVKELIDLRPWMKGKTFELLTKASEVEAYIDRLIEKGLCGLDLETSGLNTRLKKDGSRHTEIVGVCLAISPNSGAYIPVLHEDKEYNVPLKFMVQQLKRLTSNCVSVFHNFKFDGEVLRNHGIIIENEDMYEDTYILAAIQDSSRREKGLKFLSEHVLKRPMIELTELGVTGAKKNIVAFDMVPPQTALYYGASDAMNSLGLFHVFKADIDKQDPDGKQGPWYIYKIEKRCLFVTMEMERNCVKIDKNYLIKVREEVHTRMKKLLTDIHSIAGREFDINSPKQLGTVLFDELKVKYPTNEKSASGQYKTDEKTLMLIEQNIPIVNKILSYRGYTKLIGTYIDNFLNNVDEDDCAKFQLNQVRADTGRYSASGGKGISEDGYSGVNCQNIPTFNKSDHDSVDLRKAVIARPGYKIATVDYSGEELRIAANMSREPKWIYEFNHGTGDLHTITGQIIHGKTDISKQERGLGKTLNFHTIYGGGAGGFAVRAKLPVDIAKKMLFNFFSKYNVLAKWLSDEAKRAKKRGYSKTAFGRRRPLSEFYESNDRQTMSKGDRCAINSAIQGCLQPQERVLTNKGYIAIKEVQDRKNNGEEFYVWTGTSWESFDVINRGKCQFAKITLSNGLRLYCDTRHEVLVVGETGAYNFRKYNDLEEGDFVCVSAPRAMEYGSVPEKTCFPAWGNKDINISDDYDYEFISYLLGLSAVDCLINKESITINLGKRDYRSSLPKVNEGVRRLGLKVGSYHWNPLIGYKVSVTSESLVSVFDYFGFNYSKVPKLIFESPLFMRKAFVRGFISSYSDKWVCPIDFLEDVQSLAWTVGLASEIVQQPEGHYALYWSDLSEAERVLGIGKLPGKRRVGEKMYLPKILNMKIYYSFKDIEVKDSKDIELLKALNKCKKVSVQNVVKLLDKYNIFIPDMKYLYNVYYHYKLKSKENFEKVDHTYTLFVHSYLHRFDSSCIISKNTGADVIKIALYRVWKWIHSNGFDSNDIRILMPIHDEIVYEIREDKLGYFIENIADLMCLKDYTDKLQWPVGFTVDAEYGDSLSVTNDYFKEKKLLEEKSLAEGVALKSVKDDAPRPGQLTYTGEEPLKAMPLATPEVIVPGEITYCGEESIKDMPVINTVNSKEDIGQDKPECRSMQPAAVSQTVGNQYINFTVTFDDVKEKLSAPVKDEADNTALSDTRLKDRLDDMGFYVREIKSIDQMSSIHIKNIFLMLEEFDAYFVGPRCRVKLVAPDGTVLHKVYSKMSIDAFEALCLWHNI